MYPNLQDRARWEKLKNSHRVDDIHSKSEIPEKKDFFGCPKRDGSISMFAVGADDKKVVKTTILSTLRKKRNS